MALKAVTFDFHNTLACCDAWFELEVRELAPAILRELAARGLVAPDAERAEWARTAYRALRVGIAATGQERDALDCALATLTAVGVTAPPDTVAAIIAALMRETLAGARPMPGAIAAIRALRARGLRCGVVSSAIYHPFLEWTLERFGVRDAFASVVTSASCGCYKSHPVIYEAALRDLAVAPTEAVHVGDSYRYDIAGARRAGLRTIWYASTEEAMAQAVNEADATVADLASLPDVIAALDGGAGRRWWRR